MTGEIKTWYEESIDEEISSIDRLDEVWDLLEDVSYRSEDDEVKIKLSSAIEDVRDAIILIAKNLPRIRENANAENHS